MKKRHILITVSVALVTFVGMYVAATMNAIGEDYQAGLDSFKFPFMVVNVVMLVGCTTWLFLAIASHRVRTKSHAYLANFGMGVFFASVLVFCMSFAPCLIPHPTTEPHQTHHNLLAVVERSLLCPRYSNRSYPIILLYAFMGVSLFATSRWGSRQNA